MVKKRRDSPAMPLVRVALPSPSNVPEWFVLHWAEPDKLMAESKVQPLPGTPFVTLKIRFVPNLVTLRMTGARVVKARSAPRETPAPLIPTNR